jgi:hypothetical protein
MKTRFISPWNCVPPWADSPYKSYCQIYERDEGESKPRPVAYEGASCEYYEAAE